MGQIEIIQWLAFPKVEVGEPQSRCDRGFGQRLYGIKRVQDDEAKKERDNSYYNRFWQQPTCPSGKKMQPVDAAFGFKFVCQDSDDQIAGNRKEHINANKTTAESGCIEVIEDNGKNCDRSQAVDVGAVVNLIGTHVA